MQKVESHEIAEYGSPCDCGIVSNPLISLAPVQKREKAAAGVEVSDGSHSREPAKSAIIETLIGPG